MPIVFRPVKLEKVYPRSIGQTDLAVYLAVPIGRFFRNQRPI